MQIRETNRTIFMVVLLSVHQKGIGKFQRDKKKGIQLPSSLTIDEKRERRKRQSEFRNKYRPLIVRVRRENKRRTLARFIKKKDLKPKMDRLYFKNVLYRNVNSFQAIRVFVGIFY
jgi:hypothetical protein